MSAQLLRRIHFWAAVAWMFPGLLVGWWITYMVPEPHALFAVLVISLWANTVSHLGAMGAARAEEAQE